MYVLGAGLGFTMQVLITVVQNSVDRSDMGVATSSVAFFRQMGGSFGTALFGAILSSRLTVHIADALKGVPAGQVPANVGDAANNVQAIKALPEPVHTLVTGAFSDSLHDVFLSAVPLVVVALAVAFFLKEKPLATRDTPPPTAGPSSPRSSSRTDARRTDSESPDPAWGPGSRVVQSTREGRRPPAPRRRGRSGRSPRGAGPRR